MTRVRCAVMRVEYLVRWSAGLAVGLVLGAPPSFAQEDEPLDRTPEDCVVVSNIDETEVIDDQTILVYMRGKRVFRNYLRRECPGLEREDTFMYQTPSNRLCSGDSITVMERWGGRFTPGFTCRLGDFHPISREEAAAIELENERGPRRDPIVGRPVELPPPAEAPSGDAVGEGDEPPAADAADAND